MRPTELEPEAEYLNAIAAAKEEPEIRNILKNATRDHRLSVGQRDAILGLGRSKIRTVAKLAAIETTQGAGAGGESTSHPTPAPVKGVASALKAAVAAEVIDHEDAPSELVVREPSKAVLPIVSAKQMREAITAWDEIAKAIERPEDLCDIAGKKYRRLSFWRKVGNAYGISVKQLSKSSTSGDSKTGERPTAEVHLRLSLDGGRFVDAVGLASGVEKNRADMSEHGIVSLAWSRAYARGCRVLIGFGEPSAEEVGSDD